MLGAASTTDVRGGVARSTAAAYGATTSPMPRITHVKGSSRNAAYIMVCTSTVA